MDRNVSICKIVKVYREAIVFEGNWGKEWNIG